MELQDFLLQIPAFQQLFLRLLEKQKVIFFLLDLEPNLKHANCPAQTTFTQVAHANTKSREH